MGIMEKKKETTMISFDFIGVIYSKKGYRGNMGLLGDNRA